MSGFILNGIGALLGFLKIGIVAYSVSKNDLISFFLYIAIWGLFASLGEAVRQGARQVANDMNWQKFGGVAKCESTQILPFSVIVLIACLIVPNLRASVKVSDLLITLVAGYLFSFTSLLTGLLESRGAISIANWISLTSQLVLFPVFVYSAKYLNFSFLLGMYL